MTDITIPSEAVEAAAAEIFKIRLAERPYPHSPHLIEWLIDVARQDATAALRAGIAAWPGMRAARNGSSVSLNPHIILPLPTENTNAEG